MLPRAPAGYPNAAALAGVSGISSSNPPIAISRQPRRNAPRVSSPATGTATLSNSSSGKELKELINKEPAPPEASAPPDALAV